MWVAIWSGIALLFAASWLPQFTRFQTDVIIGRSMEPTIPLWSVIAVEPVDPTQVRRGDVITFQRPDRESMKVTHRVVKVGKGKTGPIFTTKGDANPTADRFRVSYEKQAWRVHTHVPYIGWILYHAQSLVARVLLVALPTLLLLVQFLVWLWKPQPDESDDAKSLAVETA